MNSVYWSRVRHGEGEIKGGEARGRLKEVRLK